MITTGQPTKRFKVDPAQLSRWRRLGYITPTPAKWSGSGYRLAWPDWTARMGALLVNEAAPTGANQHGAAARAGLYRATADWLAGTPADPVQFVVRVDDGQPLPAWTAGQVAALCAGVQVHAEIVAIPV